MSPGKLLFPGFPKGSRGRLFPGSPIFLQLGFFSLELEKGAIKFPDLLHQSPIIPLSFHSVAFTLSPNIQIKDYRNISRYIDRERVLFSPRGFFYHVLLVFSHSILSFNKPRMVMLSFLAHP